MGKEGEGHPYLLVHLPASSTDPRTCLHTAKDNNSTVTSNGFESPTSSRELLGIPARRVNAVTQV